MNSGFIESYSLKCWCIFNFFNFHFKIIYFYHSIFWRCGYRFMQILYTMNTIIVLRAQLQNTVIYIINIFYYSILHFSLNFATQRWRYLPYSNFYVISSGHQKICILHKFLSAKSLRFCYDFCFSWHHC